MKKNIYPPPGIHILTPITGDFLIFIRKIKVLNFLSQIGASLSGSTRLYVC